MYHRYSMASGKKKKDIQRKKGYCSGTVVAEFKIQTEKEKPLLSHEW